MILSLSPKHWAFLWCVAAFLMLWANKRFWDRMNAAHIQAMKKHADEAAERHARNSILPKDGKTTTILP